MAKNMDTLRLRIVFNNSDILSDAQKSQGLEKTWILVPQNQTNLRTVAQLSAYIVQTFHLQRSCPHGLLICMDGFVLPPFESTGILKDKDVISVKKKEVLAILGNETADGVEGFEILQRRPENIGALRLANVEFDSESGGCRREESHDEPLENDKAKSLERTEYLEDGNKISKKRKAVEKLQGLEKRKQRSEPHENGVLSGEKSTSKKRKSSKKNHTNVETIDNEDEKADKDAEFTPKSELKSSKKNHTKVGTIENGDEKIDNDVESTPKSKQRSSKKKKTNVGIENGDEKFDKDAESTPKSKQKKKRRSEPSESAANNVHDKPVGGHHENEFLSGEKSTSKKRKSSKKSKSNVGSPGLIENGESENDKDAESTPKTKQNEQAQENCKDIDGNAAVSESSPKRPSRSARRKKAKRKWLSEMAKIKNKSVDSQEVKNWKEMQSSAGKKEVISVPEKEVVGQLEKEGLGNPKGLLQRKQCVENSKTWSNLEEENQNHNKHGNSNSNSSTVNEVVPIEIRPGHIRFEPLSEDADHSVQRSQASVLSVETFHWNGITSKKKGQRWGRDQGYVSRGNDYQFKQEEDGNKWGTDKCSVYHGKDYEQSKHVGKNQGGKLIYPVSHGNDDDETMKDNEMDVDTHTHVSEQMDFDKLPPLPALPKEGDVIAYRLLELSSSWTPEMSSFRVGKVSVYDSQSRKVMLMPLPQYPIIFKESEEEESTQQEDGNLYNEDGSLEIEFTSLIDVRIVKSGDLDTSASNGVLDQCNGGSICTNNMETPKLPDNKDRSDNIVVQGDCVLDQRKPAEVPSTGNGVNLWEQFSDALKTKKLELKGSRSSSWSHRVLKGSTLGPTMAFLRSENDNKKMVM